MNELYHYGIKGQRWGVRRYQRSDGTLTPAGKKRYADDIVMKKGDEYSHLSTQKSINFKNRSTYLINTPNDLKVYGGTYAGALAKRQMEAGNHNPKVYAHVLKDKHGAIIAGEKTMRRMFDDMLSKHEKVVLNNMKFSYDNYLKRGLIKDNTPYNKFSKDKNRMFELFSRSTLSSYSVTDSMGGRKQYLYEPDVILGEMYTKSLQNKKYAGMLDLNDKGRWFGAEQPMIIFNGKKYLEDTDVFDLPLNSIAQMNSKLMREGRRSYQNSPL